MYGMTQHGRVGSLEDELKKVAQESGGMADKDINDLKQAMGDLMDTPGASAKPPGTKPSDYGWSSQNTAQLLNLLGAAGLTAMKVWATNAAAGRATGPLNQQKWFTAEMQKKVQQNAALQQQLSALMAANAKAQQAQQGVPVWVWVIGGVMGAALVGGAVYLIAKK